MHRISLETMKAFIDSLPDTEQKILDVGSKIVNGQEALGSYRQFCKNPKWTYLGADIEPGNNVDIVLEKGYEFPFKDKEFDVVISGQTMEHLEYPWLWIKEVARVLKKSGLCCIIAPAKIHEHRFPIDTYRYYPDGMRAMAAWARLEPITIEKIVVNKGMEDTYLIARK